MEASGERNFLIDGFPRSADNLQGWEANMTDCADVARVGPRPRAPRLLLGN